MMAREFVVVEHEPREPQPGRADETEKRPVLLGLGSVDALQVER